MGFNYLFIFPSIMLPSEVPRLATDSPVRMFSGVWKPLFFKTPFLGQICVPTSFVFSFSFCIFPYLLSKKEMVTHSSILAWRIPWTEKSGWLQSMGLQRVGHDWATSLSLLKTIGCFSVCLMSSASIQKLFCGVCSALICSFDEFVREKVVSPSYSSAILGPPHHLTF